MKNQKSKIKNKKFKRGGSYEGLQEDVRRLKTPEIEVWKNKYRDKEYTIFMETPEFSCICPKTGLPDFANIRIQYIPDEYCIELKSFKLYLISFRNIGIFHENVVNRILDDLVRACRPRWMNIVGEFNPRGGIKTIVSRQYRVSEGS
jgi:7-cyano-7-deazaguanine reductase